MNVLSVFYFVIHFGKTRLTKINLVPHPMLTLGLKSNRSSTCTWFIELKDHLLPFCYKRLDKFEKVNELLSKWLCTAQCTVGDTVGGP